MTKIENHLSLFKKYRLSTIIRTNNANLAYKVVQASVNAGIKFVEITLTIPGANELIKKCRNDFNDLIIGAGTVLTLTDAKKAVASGAQYLVSPVTNLEILKWSLKNDILFIAGAFSPSEMYTLYSNGAKLIKFYPATANPIDYIKLIKQPLPNLEILATGGINLENIKSFLNAGCLGCGVTDQLGNPAENATIEELTKIAQSYQNQIK